MTQKRAGKRKTKKAKRQLVQRTSESGSANEKRTPRSRHLRNTLILVLLGIVIFSAIVFSVNWHSTPQQPEDIANVNVSRAAILDGLGDREPNSTLIQSTVQYLSNSGYTVDVYSGTHVTIDLLENIGGYKILILRLHSTRWRGSLYLFSDEEYDITKYVYEQLAGEVTMATTFDKSEPPYFALNSVCLGKLKPNGLNGTTLILMGCDGTTSQIALQAFLIKGIQAYISWNGFVNLPHSDEASLRLVKAMYLEGLSPKAAVDEVNREVGPDPFYRSKLICVLS